MMRMYIQPMSNSYHLFDSFADVANVVVVQLFATDHDAPREQFVLASAELKLR